VHTLRLWAHFEAEAQGGRPDLRRVPEHDPISIYRDRLLEAGALTDGRYQGMQASVGEQVDGG
jgi:TPP-dependent pyruvate/acetoin dehydrogenase alpha subunit